jgi:hypothetical protein
VTDGDLDADGVVRDERVAQWVAGARSAYPRRCAALRRVRQASGLELQDRVAPLPPGAALGRPAAVVVTAGVREVWPSSFALAVRLRPVDGTATARWTSPASCGWWTRPPASPASSAPRSATS